MGKQKRRRYKPHQENPTGLLSVKNTEEETDNAVDDSEKTLQRVLEQLNSPDMEEKMSGLQTLDSMSCQPLMAIQIAKRNIGKIIGPLLLDDNKLIRAGSASTLRSIAENGGEEAYCRLLEDDLMTPIITLLKQHYFNWDPKLKSKDRKKENEESEIFIQVVTLLWTLAEKNENIIRRSNSENILDILIKFLETSVYGVDLSVVAIQCMLILSEDNSIAISKLKEQEDTLINLLNWKSSNIENNIEDRALQTAAAGLLMNIHNSLTYETNSLIIARKILSVLSETLSINYKEQLESLVSSIVKKKHLSRSMREFFNKIERIVTVQQQALEILANLCNDECQESDGDSTLDDSDEYEVEQMDIDVMADKSFELCSNIPVELSEVIVGSDLMKNVWEKSRGIDENMKNSFKEHTEGVSLLKKFSILRCRAFLCLNNLFSCLDIDTLGGVDYLYRLWTEIGKVVFSEADPNDIDLLESATSAMRAALQKLAEGHANVFHNLSLEDLQPILNGERQCPNSNVRANLIRMLGNLVIIMMNDGIKKSESLIKHVSLFLLETCTRENEVWIIAESIDAIMDIFSEDETDILADEINLIEKLQLVVPIIKNKIRQQKRTLGDNTPLVSTVKVNLHRFIKYKQQRIAKLKVT